MTAKKKPAQHRKPRGKKEDKAETARWDAGKSIRPTGDRRSRFRNHKK